MTPSATTAPPNTRLGPAPSSAIVAEAGQWVEQGRPDHAARLYASALEQDPSQTRVRLQLADCLVRCSQAGAAAQQYMQVANQYAAQRRDGETMAICYRVLHLDPRQFVYVAVAELLRRIGRPAKALCARAAEAHLAMGCVSDGMHMLKLGTELAPRDSDARRRLARLYISQHRTTEAVATLAEAGRLLLTAGNNGEYVEVAVKILQLDPRHLETLRQLPRVYLRVGEPQQAVVVLSDLMRHSPGDTVGYEILAHAFAVIGRTTTALSVLERLTRELASTARRAQAHEIIERARVWRLDDAEFERAVIGLAGPRAPAPPAPRAAHAHHHRGHCRVANFRPHGGRGDLLAGRRRSAGDRRGREHHGVARDRLLVRGCRAGSSDRSGGSTRPGSPPSTASAPAPACHCARSRSPRSIASSGATACHRARPRSPRSTASARAPACRRARSARSSAPSSATACHRAHPRSPRCTASSGALGHDGPACGSWPCSAAGPTTAPGARALGRDSAPGCDAATAWPAPHHRRCTRPHTPALADAPRSAPRGPAADGQREHPGHRSGRHRDRR